MTTYNPKEFAESRRDSRSEKAVLYWLRTLDDSKRLGFVWTVLNHNWRLGLVLVERCQFQPVYLEIIFERGLVYGDVSSVADWIKAVLPGLGTRGVLRIIRSHMDKAPLCVYKTLYWLPLVCCDAPDDVKQEARQLIDDFAEKYPDYRPNRSVGTH